MKKYLDCTITPYEGKIIKKTIKISQLNLIRKMVKENRSVHIMLMKCNNEYYKFLFK